jgi:hypothetical protein
MIILIRFLLVSLIAYLIIRSFRRYVDNEQRSTQKHEPDKNSKISSKGVSKKLGEYVDYEEIDK